MKNKKPTLTIAITAYNEENNIANILNSLLLQKKDKIDLSYIIVYSDCSSDNTERIVSQLSKKNHLIKLVKGKSRKGKYYRCEQALNACKTDYIVIMDADLGLSKKTFLEILVKDLESNPEINMLAAHNIILRPKNFIGKLIFAHLMIWENIRFSIPNYESGVNYFGSATAFRKDFANKFKIPSGVSDPHIYFYLSAKTKNGFKYCREAEVLQWPVSTIKDLKKFMGRSLGKKDIVIEKMFGDEAEKAYRVPTKYKIIGLLKALSSSPFYTTLALGLHFYITKIFKVKNPNKTPIWDIVTSTKKPIAYEK